MYDFRTFKERGEWVEAQFIAEALRRGYKVLKPRGDSQAFDVAANFGNRIVRVRVKSTTCRVGTGYRCEFEPNQLSTPYTLDQLDFLAAYIVPQKTLVRHSGAGSGEWRPPEKRPDAIPHAAAQEKSLPFYEGYKEAWELLGLSQDKGGQR